MRRSNRNSLARRPNPLREMALEQRRATEAIRDRQRAERLKADLPSIIDNQVGEHIQRLEDKLLNEFKEIGQRAVDESTAVLHESLDERIGQLEQISSLQSQTIVNLRDSSRVADQKVSSVVNSIEQSLSKAVPGFQLEPPQHPQHQIEPPKASKAEVDAEDGKYGFCPSCTSTKVRRANRKGLWEQVLRAFFCAPFRCRSCRYKFYKFTL